MALRNTGDRIDLHIKLTDYHLKILDSLSIEYAMSRSKVIAGLLEEYADRIRLDTNELADRKKETP
jgi:metal-responsive CopG/Arc/MetJ family transcriptional regulator